MHADTLYTLLAHAAETITPIRLLIGAHESAFTPIRVERLERGELRVLTGQMPFRNAPPRRGGGSADGPIDEAPRPVPRETLVLDPACVSALFSFTPAHDPAAGGRPAPIVSIPSP